MMAKENKSHDRILVLEPIEGMRIKDVQGRVDSRLFNGDNKLHCVMDVQSSLWHFKYEDGVLPEPLKQRFTSWSKAKYHADEYYKKRNVQIAKVID